jgi:sulfate permease, SulP family
MYACSKARNGAVAAQGAVLLVAAHGWVRDLLCANGIAEKVGGLDRVATLDHPLGVDDP